MANTIFEKTMRMCLESKKQGQQKPVNRKVKTKTNKLVEKKKSLREEEEFLQEEDMEMDDISDDVVVVIDPELDDISDGVDDELQDIVDSTPDGEVPTHTEYIGDMIYSCPICGNTFLSEEEMLEDEECPVCGNFPDNFVFVGKVEEAPVGEDLEDEELFDDEDLELNLEDEELVEESKRPIVRKRSKTKNRSYMIDEKTFNPFLNRFVKENYKNAKSLELVSAVRTGNKLTLEAKLTFKSGNTKTVKFECARFIPRVGKAKLAFRNGDVFKSESRKNVPFMFDVTISDNRIIKCEGLKYSIFTKSLKENKKVEIYGNLRRNFQKGRRI